jgi:L-ascorbate metabolism protein UlaG (beta-lactamase superfamily)
VRRSSTRWFPWTAILGLAALSCAPVRSLLLENTAALVCGPAPAPGHVEQPVRPDARLAVVWIGHATALVQIEDKLVLTDPVFTRTIGELGARLVAPGLEAERLPPIDAVLISHMHMDHLSFGSLEQIERVTRALFVPAGGLVYVPDLDFPAFELGTWQSWESGGLRITAVPVQHTGFRYGADAAWMTHTFTGYVIQYRGVTVYFGGDTAYAKPLFEETARRFPSIDLALLPIAPIHPREIMSRVHMDPEEALAAFADLRARWMVPIHHSTFVNSFDAPGEALATLRTGMARRGLDGRTVMILGQGEQRVLIPR